MERMENLQNLPDEMKKMEKFILWRLEPAQNRSKPIKRPLSARHGYPIAITQPGIGVTLEEAIKATKRFDVSGIGFVLDAETKAKGITCIDLDNCFNENNTLCEWAEEIVKKFPKSYIEMSQSLRGLHLFFKSNFQHNGRRKGGIEIYTCKRYIAVTGVLWPEVAV